LLAAVLVPTACVLWFMAEAVRNEQLAVRQRLEDLYRERLIEARDQMDTALQERLEKIDLLAATQEPPLVFATIAEKKWADGAIIHDASGRVCYPTEFERSSSTSLLDDLNWQEAERFEFLNQDFAAAAALYKSIAEKQTDPAGSARALLAQARCFAKGGKHQAALDILTWSLAESRFSDARDPEGRLIAPNALLLALRLMGDPLRADFEPPASVLARRLADYSPPAMPSAQRRFLMKELTALWPNAPQFPTLAAEEIAAEYLESEGRPPAEDSQFSLAGPARLWQLAMPTGRVTLLMKQEPLFSEMQAVVESQLRIEGMSVKFELSRNPMTPSGAFLSIPGGKYLPFAWLELHLEDSGAFVLAAEGKTQGYIWTGTLVIALVAILALLIGRSVFRQMKLTRLKNDLIATVSHELKTPLSSMRVLVDTLLEERCKDEQQKREYLQLIAKENARLSRLIDNFLTFSRMERNKRAFEFTEVHASEIITSVMEAMKERFEAPECRLEVKVDSNLPPVMGDRDALITVLLNLLDNAWKYSGPQKHVIVRGFASAGQIGLEVQDNGVGLSKRAVKKIFDRFYQVDQRLSRETGGCGLGLSIVEFIVAAHGGTIEVQSRPGSGSTFTVRLPVAGNGARASLQENAR